MKALGPHSHFPRVYPNCRWPRRIIQTLVRTDGTLMVIKHWPSAPSISKRNPEDEDLILAEDNALKSPFEHPPEVPVLH